MNNKIISINKFRRTILFRLPKDKPGKYPGDWHKSQKWHWYWWLLFYKTEGVYKRQTGHNRDARYAYNHIVCPEMLLYLIEAIPFEKNIIKAVYKAYEEKSPSQMTKSGAIHKIVPWSSIYDALWG